LTLEVDVAEGLLEVRGDRERIAQVLTDLLSTMPTHTRCWKAGSPYPCRWERTSCESRLCYQSVIY